MAKPKQGNLCPLIGEDCRELECAWYTQISGTNPQTGEPVNEYGCAVAWIPFLQVDNSKVVNQMGAAIESFRNETVEKMSPIVQLEQPRQKLIKITENEDFDNT
jgi:hypothetical protein|tara:strand:- start:225 stop:536 length:312 start_codon:yes stop_codon:yes gene_type:complete